MPLSSVLGAQSLVRPGVCTSSTRPASPFEGQVIYETDTDLVQVYNGSGWKALGRMVASTNGSVLQVVSTTKTDTFSSATGANNFVDVTGLSATITPTSTSSKVLVVASVCGAGGVTTVNGFQAKLAGGNTASYVGDAASSRVRGVAQTGTAVGDQNRVYQIFLNYLDSPSTTSATTYKVQVSAIGSGDTVYVNRSQADTDSNLFMRGASTITVMEIAG